MNADASFRIGAAHAVCQDYALARNRPPGEPRAESGPRACPYVILSDGCSSSPDTDVGARLLVRAAEQALVEPGGQAAPGAARMHEEAAGRALAWAELLGLRTEAADATLLTAHTDGDELIAACTGDGVICLQSAAGALDVYDIACPSGYPLYPAYALQPGRLRAPGGEGRFGKELKRFHSASVEEPLRLVDVSDSDRLTEVFTVKARDYRYAALFSDGVHSFRAASRAATSKGAEAVPADEVLRGLVSFKSARGAFVARRVNGFLRDCGARGWRHADDLAFGALHLGD
jgi:hypothetical protein